jgi:lantibiotic biosynthesis dehydratase-like protein
MSDLPGEAAAVADVDRQPATLSVNLYCDRHFHGLLRQVAAPLGQELPTLAPGTVLWFWRYSRCGQHLKLRLHTADETGWPALQNRIRELAEQFFATLPEAGAETPPRISTSRLPPIDKEDERDDDYPDRSILWTRFQPSPRTVGHEKYLTDHRLLNLFYRCLGANSERVLAEVLAAGDEPALKAKQSQLLRTVVPAFLALDLSPQEQISYLGFHRDWLLRYLLAQSPPQTTADETVARLDRKLEGMEATVSALSAIIADQGSPQAEPEEEDELAALRAAMRNFFDHAQSFRGRPEYDLDPYTSDFAFLPLFKVLHSFGNQIGVPILNEFYTYQLLLRAVERAHLAATSFASGQGAGDE